MQQILLSINTLRPRQNGRHFPDDNFKRIFFNENVWFPIKISLKFVPNGPIDNIPTLVQIMAWRRPGDKPLFEPMMVSFLTHICVTRPQWVNTPEQNQPIHKGYYTLANGKSPVPFTNMGLLWSQHEYIITSIIMSKVELLTHPQTSVATPLKFSIGLVISSHILLDMWLVILAGIRVNPCW